MYTTIEEATEAVRSHFQTATKLVLQATPGMGKTTRVPLALLNEPWLGGRKVIMLEPRRVATRMAAHYMSQQLGEKVGDTVGYRIRRESRVSPATRLEIVTDGVFTRMIQDDPSLEDVALVIFDEFHERGAQIELGLALALQTQSLFRPDLRLMLMSATIDGPRLAEWLGNAPLVVANGRNYPLDIRYFPRVSADELLTEHVVRALAFVACHCGSGEFEPAGDVLVFLPGVGEIERVQRALQQQPWLRSENVEWRLFPLHGRMPLEQQLAALNVTKEQVNEGVQVRRIVLSTSLAESSVTVDGVRIVIDGGWSRVNRFSARTGLSRLETVRVSKASAVQRAGRAARLGPGVCMRLWHADEERTLVDQQKGELQASDLLRPALELLLWGVHDPSELQWLEPWPLHNWQQALEVLRMLGALDERDVPNEHGRMIARAGTDVRIASMLMRAAAFGWHRLACELAAGMSEDGSGNELLVQEECERLLKWLAKIEVQLSNVKPPNFDRDEQVAVMLAWAFPERVALRRQASNHKLQELHKVQELTYRLANGRGCKLPSGLLTHPSEWIVVVDADDHGADANVRRAVALSERAFQFACGASVKRQRRVIWDDEQQMIRSLEFDMYMQIEWKWRVNRSPLADDVMAVWANTFRQKGLGLLRWDKKSVQLLQRMRALTVLGSADDDYPDLSDDALAATVTEWVGAPLAACRTLADIGKLEVADFLRNLLDYEQWRLIDAWLPTHWQVPSGSRIAIDYSEPGTPVLAVRLQEMFGLRATPRLASGRLPLTFQLLSPAGRPVQVTRDLQSFWSNTYPDVRKELRGRYPKHVWPDDPFEAVPTARAKPRSKS